MRRCYSLFSIAVLLLLSQCQQQYDPVVGRQVSRYDRPEASILKGVKVSLGNDYFFSSGLVGPVLDTAAEIGDPRRYGDTYTQSVGTLKRIEETLAEAGYELSDVIKMNVYIAPDHAKDGEIDFDAWFKAYGEFFNNEKNPTKVARTTLGVAALARKGLLVEIEVVAVRP